MTDWGSNPGKLKITRSLQAPTDISRGTGEKRESRGDYELMVPSIPIPNFLMGSASLVKEMRGSEKSPTKGMGRY